jgi:signal peptidase I
MAITRRQAILGFAASACAPSLAHAQATEPLRTFRIPSGSMEPNLLIGDVVLTRWTGRPGAPALQRGDVIVFRRETEFWCKRVIGLPGDEVAIRRGVPQINGEALLRVSANGLGRNDGPRLLRETLGDRSYRIQVRDQLPKRSKEAALRREMSALRVPDGELFLLGDNRDDSLDSRGFGTAPIADVRFVAVQVVFSRDAGRIGFRLDRNAA